MDNYEDIIHRKRPVSLGHAPMDMADRAAQFAPFAALTGYDGVIAETGRLTQSWEERTESALEELDADLRAVVEDIHNQPQITVTRFCPDVKKSGGRFVTVTGQAKKIDPYKRVLVFTDGRVIPLDEIAAVNVK